MRRWGGSEARYRIPIGLLLVLLGLLAFEAWAVSVASNDPFGLSGAPALGVDSIDRAEPLYGAAWTPDRALAWSRDGRLVALGGDGRVQLLDARTGSTLKAWKVPGSVNVIRWSPDGRTLAVGADTAGFIQDGWVFLYNDNGLPIASWHAHNRTIGGIDFSPDGTRIVSTSVIEFAIWDATGGLVYRDSNASTHGETASWSPDGAAIAVGSGGAAIYDAATGELRSAPESGRGAWARVAWSPRGDLLAAAADDGTLSLFHPDGTLERRATILSAGGDAFGRDLAWSPDGSMIVLADSSGLAIVSAERLDVLRVLVFPIQEFRPQFYGFIGIPLDYRVAWSPDGAAIAALGTMSHPTFRLWGIRHTNLGLPLLLGGAAGVLGLSLVVGRDLLWVLVSPDRAAMIWSRTDPLLKTGRALFAYAVFSSILFSLGGAALGRVYDLQGEPPWTWFALSAILSLPVVWLAAAAASFTFHKLMWPTPGPHPFASIPHRVYGYVLLPSLLFVSLAELGVGAVLLTSPGLDRGSAPWLLPGFFGVLAGVGFYMSGRAARGFPWSRGRFPWFQLGISAAASVATFFALVILLVITLNVLQFPPVGVLATDGITLYLSFGLVPLLAAIVALATSAAIGLAPSAARFLIGGYARAHGDAVLELKTRRSVLSLVDSNPGSHFRLLLRESGLGSGTLYYHLTVLEREGYVVARRQGRKRVFFSSLGPGVGVDQAVSVL